MRWVGKKSQIFWFSLCVVSQIYVSLTRFDLNSLEQTYNSNVTVEMFMDFDKDGAFDFENDSQEESEDTSSKKASAKLVDSILLNAFCALVESTNFLFNSYKLKIYLSPDLKGIFRPPRGLLAPFFL